MRNYIAVQRLKTSLGEDVYVVSLACVNTYVSTAVLVAYENMRSGRLEPLLSECSSLSKFAINHSKTDGKGFNANTAERNLEKALETIMPMEFCRAEMLPIEPTFSRSAGAAEYSMTTTKLQYIDGLMRDPLITICDALSASDLITDAGINALCGRLQITPRTMSDLIIKPLFEMSDNTRDTEVAPRIDIESSVPSDAIDRMAEAFKRASDSAAKSVLETGKMSDAKFKGWSTDPYGETGMTHTGVQPEQSKTELEELDEELDDLINETKLMNEGKWGLF